MATKWNGLSFMFSENSYMTLIIILAITVVWLLWSVSSYFRDRNQPPLPPGNLGLPFIGQTVEYVLALRSADGIREWFQKKNDRYGPVFKWRFWGCEMVMMDQPEGNQFVFQNEGTSHHIFWPVQISTLLGPDSLIRQTGEHHKLNRRYFNRFFDHSSMSRYLPEVNRNAVRHFTEFWQGKEQVVAHEMTNLYTFSTICNLVLTLEKGPQMEKFLLDFDNWAKGLLSLPINLPGFQYCKALKARKSILEMLGGLVEQRRGEIAEDHVLEAAKIDILNNLLTVPDEEGNLLQDSSIKDNLLLLLLAGFDTSSSVLAMAIYYIAKHPHVYKEIVHEHKLILEEKLARWRKTVTNLEYKGYFIPKGWLLVWSQSTNYSSKYFQDPLKFDPSRWEKSPPLYTYLPFSTGSHACLGYEFARMEMLVYIHHLVKRYSWALIDPNVPIIRDPFPKTLDKTFIAVKEITSF
ncbi:hypothetical protein R1sor_021592 [Riccia sorocarpa]|uniref:Cytochrome P450 n=1 Tax=Riccia sorocarpa TaxID=122646 RepID=A0ABD3GIY2_9MARC